MRSGPHRWGYDASKRVSVQIELLKRLKLRELLGDVAFEIVAPNMDGLNRVSNKLDGNIPKEFAKLQAPKKFSLNGNPLGGVIPRELRGLPTRCGRLHGSRMTVGRYTFMCDPS